MIFFMQEGIQLKWDSFTFIGFEGFYSFTIQLCWLRMTNKPFTLLQASALAKRFRSLTGKIFCNEKNKGTFIECVTIAPYDEINKWMFVQFYAEYRSLHKALAFYAYPYYDVLVLASIHTTSKKIHFDDIRSYLHPAPKTEWPAPLL